MGLSVESPHGKSNRERCTNYKCSSQWIFIKWTHPCNSYSDQDINHCQPNKRPPPLPSQSQPFRRATILIFNITDLLSPLLNFKLNNIFTYFLISHFFCLTFTRFIHIAACGSCSDWFNCHIRLQIADFSESLIIEADKQKIIYISFLYVFFGVG